MSKSNKELAIDVAIAVITSNPKTVSSNNSVSMGLGIPQICNIIESVTSTLDKIDNNIK